MVARHLRPSERLTAISSRTHLKETKYASILSILSFHLSWFYPLKGGQRAAHRRPSLQVSSSTAKSACAFDTDKLRTNDHVCKNKRSGRSRACARASRRLTTERRSLIHEKTRTRVRISHDETTEAENRTAFAHAHASRLNQRWTASNGHRDTFRRAQNIPTSLTCPRRRWGAGYPPLSCACSISPVSIALERCESLRAGGWRAARGGASINSQPPRWTKRRILAEMPLRAFTTSVLLVCIHHR